MFKLFILILVLAGTTSFSADYYVSPDGNDSGVGTAKDPFQSIEGARDEVRKLISAGLREDINVYIKGGTYRLRSTIVFGPEDSAPEGRKIIYRAFKNEKPVFSAGKIISGFKKIKKAPEGLPSKSKTKVWVTEVPESKGGKWRFRTLFENGKMLRRAQAKGWAPPGAKVKREERWKNLNSIPFPEGALKKWKNLDDVEVVIRPNHVWIVNYLGLKNVDMKKFVARTTIPATYTPRNGLKNSKESAWVENVLEGLDSPGEWVLNTREGKLYLWPLTGRPGRIEAPRFRELFKVEGKNVDALEGDIPVRGIEFIGLTFTMGDRDVWTKDDRGIQHDWDMWDKDNALLRFRGAENCAVRDSTFRDTGSSAIRVDLYAKNIEITGNHIHDIGATAILLCGYGPGKKDVNKNHLVKENHIHHIGKLYWHSPAFFIWQSGENKILNNYVHHLPYDAVVLSGVRPRYFNITDPVKWTQKDVIPRTIRENMRTIRWKEVGKPKTAAEARVFAHARNNLIQDNEFHDVMQKLGDGNAIYLSCAGEGNIIKRNLIYRSMRAQSEIRFDDDQEKSYVVENIIFGNGIKIKHENYIENNVLIGGQIYIRPETTLGSRVERNILYSRKKKGVSFYGSNTPERKLKNLLKLAHPDRNLFYSENHKEGRIRVEILQKLGHEKQGKYADPRFRNLERGDVRLKSDSPALGMGIRSIRMEKIGLGSNPALPRIMRQGLEKLFTSDNARM